LKYQFPSIHQGAISAVSFVVLCVCVCVCVCFDTQVHMDLSKAVIPTYEQITCVKFIKQRPHIFMFLEITLHLISDRKLMIFNSKISRVLPANQQNKYYNYHMTLHHKVWQSHISLILTEVFVLSVRAAPTPVSFHAEFWGSLLGPQVHHPEGLSPEASAVPTATGTSQLHSWSFQFVLLDYFWFLQPTRISLTSIYVVSVQFYG